MYRFRRFIYAVLTLVLTIAVVCDAVIALELIGHFFGGGLGGVNSWITHIGTEGRIRMVLTGPDAVLLEFPSKASAFGGFVVMCVFFISVTAGTWWGRRFFELKRRGSPGQ